MGDVFWWKNRRVNPATAVSEARAGPALGVEEGAAVEMEVVTEDTEEDTETGKLLLA